MTQYGKNVIFCGPAQMLDQPIRKEAPVAAASAPGAVAHLDGDGKLAIGGGSVCYVLDKDHLGGGQIDEEYEAGDRATAFYGQSGLVLNVRAEGGQTISEDAPLWPTSTGTLTATDPADGTAVLGHSAENVTTGGSPQLVAVKFI
ncbi:hypothetical protein RSO41_14095 [Halomonas sp. I1]|uniref:hypothetical protein n=1 Tax=Halomonas sp. I1 TaxID=393536 RepID=UPI0028DD4B03|nr:hypothetical protein [Halomonas sp. I1]MDT8895785.1 hypothetical protein [Halomonas sp. I1]